MQGYKVFYDKKQKKFVVSEKESEMRDVAIDSTTCWGKSQEDANAIAEDLNADMVDSFDDITNDRQFVVVVCHDCNKSFMLSAGEYEWYRNHDMEPPKRCKACRDKRKKTANKRVAKKSKN